MRKSLLFILILFPVVLLAQIEENPGKRKLMIKVPIINGSLGYSILPDRDLPVETQLSLETLGFGFWYFTKRKWSYQIDGNFRTIVNRYATYSMVNSKGERSEHSRTYIRPQLSLAANFEVANLKAAKMYVFASYHLMGGNWKGRKFISTGPGTTVNSPVVGETQFDNVYDVYITYKNVQQGFRAGWAFSNLKNSVVARFWFDFNPAKNYTYVAKSLPTGTRPDIDWTEKGKSEILFGLTFEFNTVLKGMSSF